VHVAKSSRPFQVKSSIAPRPICRPRRIFEVDFLALGVDRQQCAERARTGARVHVQGREEDVQVLGVDDQDEECQDDAE